MDEKIIQSTKEYRKLPVRALRCMYTADLVAGLIVLAVIGAVNYFWLFPKDITVGKWISLALALLTLADMTVSPYFRYHRYRYSINEECIDVIEGYLFVKRQIVPIERIHKLQTKKGPIDQAFHVAKVIVTTGGGDVTLSFLEEERAEQIADSLRKRINEIVLEQRSADERKENIWGNPWLILSFVTLTALLGIGSSGAWSCISFPAAKIVTIYGLFEGLLLAAFAGVFAYDAVKKRITAERILLIAVIPAALFPETAVFQIMMNILLALFGFVLLRNGWIHRKMLPFNGGFIMIATLLGCRFFDSGLGVLPRAAVFILLGVGFIVSNMILSRRITKEVSHV